jgi:hypothetical protein
LYVEAGHANMVNEFLAYRLARPPAVSAPSAV